MPIASTVETVTKVASEMSLKSGAATAALHPSNEGEVPMKEPTPD